MWFSWSELPMESFLWYSRLLPHIDYLLYACPAASSGKLITSQHLEEKRAVIQKYMRLLASVPYSNGNSVAELYIRKERRQRP
jgi:hypothetical protein